MISAPQSAPVDVTMDNFMTEVIEGSKTTPTIVQFWAPWCGPCKQLSPVLEKVVGASGDKVRMVRVNIDDNQQIAQQMRVQSVPTVYGFVDGQPVDGFAGAQPESNSSSSPRNCPRWVVRARMSPRCSRLPRRRWPQAIMALQ